MGSIEDRPCCNVSRALGTGLRSGALTAAHTLASIARAARGPCQALLTMHSGPSRCGPLERVGFSQVARAMGRSRCGMPVDRQTQSKRSRRTTTKFSRATGANTTKIWCGLICRESVCMLCAHVGLSAVLWLLAGGNRFCGQDDPGI